MTMTHVPGLTVEQLIQEELSWSRSPNPRHVAEQIASHVPADHLRRLLADALVHAVRKIAIRNRMRAMGVEKVNGRSAADPVALVEQPMSCGPGRWKRLGEFTADDLTDQIAHRRRRTAEEEATTARFERLAEALAAAGADRVDQLDAATRAAIFA